MRINIGKLIFMDISKINFVPFKKPISLRLQIDEDQIRVKGNNIYLSRVASNKFPNGGKVDIFIDKENKVIKLVEGSYKKLNRGVYTYSICNVHFNMPDGIYKAENDYYVLEIN